MTKLDNTGSSLVYSTFLGGNRYDYAEGIAVNSQGNAYLTGWTDSESFPTTPGAFDTTPRGYGQSDAFVVKLNPTGTGLIYGTHLGGNDWDIGNDIAVDDAGNAYVVGRAGSPDFPTTLGAFDTSFPQGSTGFITKLDSAGSALSYSTFLGGSVGGSELFGIALDGARNAYVTGFTFEADFPTTAGAFDTSFNGPTWNGKDGIVSKLNASGNALVYSTYLGGSLDDQGYDIGVDGAGNAAVTGMTFSTDFPVQHPLQATYAGDVDGFVAKLDDTGSSLSYATYLGGSIGFPSAYDVGASIAVDGEGSVYVAGVTTCSDFPTIIGALQASNAGDTDAFVAKIALTLTTLFGPVGGPSNPSGAAAEPVNTAIGNYYYQYTDLTLPGRGLGLAFTRTYNAQDVTEGPFGCGWTHRYQVYLTEYGDGSVTIRYGDGHEAFFDPNGDGTYHSRYPGVYDRLIKQSANNFLLTAKDQSSHAFTNGYLTQLRDRNGNALRFAYDGAGHLTTITDTAGRVVTLSYDATGRLLQLSGPLGRTVQYAYDANGDLASDTDPEGGIQRYTYDGSRRLTQIANRRGQVLVDNVYDSAGRVVTQTNGRGLITSFAWDSPNAGDTTITNPLGEASIHRHDGQRRLIAEIDPLGHSVQYAYDASNNRTQVTDRNGNITAYSYDTRGNVLTQTDALGGVATLTYDADDRPLTRTDALGQVTVYSYDAAGNLLAETDPLGQTTSYAYDGYGQRLSRTDGNGHTTAYAYDAQGNPTAITDPLGQSTQIAYDAAGRPIVVTDANGHATTLNYDGNDRLLSTTDALGHTVTSDYDPDGNRIQITDPKGQTSVTVYDANDNVLSVTDPTRAVTAFSYDAADQRITQTDPLGNMTRFGYDAGHRLIQVTDALDQSTGYSYDANGNRLSQTDALGQTVNSDYDALNRLTRVTDPLGNVTTWQYDALGRRTAMVDAEGRTTTYVYDARDQLVQVTDPAGNSSYAAYDAADNRLSVTNPNGQTTSYTYDAADRRLSETNALDQVTAWQYDAAGNPIQRTDAKGQITQYGYDASNRLTSIGYADATTVSFSFDANGNLTQMVDTLGTTRYAYDAGNRLTEHTDPFGNTVGHDYDAAGNRTLLIYPDNKTVGYGYDALNRLASVTDWLGNITEYAYDAAGNLTGRFNDGTGTETLFGHDAASRLTSVRDGRTDDSVIARYDLTLDAAGNRTAVDSQDPVAPSYVSQATLAAYDDADRLTNLGGSPVSHDANGNLLSQPGGSYQYDGDNRLIVANSQYYAYDGQGHRLAATRNGIATRYVLDLAAPLSQVLMERDGAGNPTAYYVYGLGLIARISPNGVARYYHYDANGNTVALTDAEGLVTDACAYSPFGDLLAQQGSTPNPFRFMGQFGVMHEGDGIACVRARYYHPATGRFLNKDPVSGSVEAGQTLNPYAYALNNPVRFVDVSGFSVMEGNGAATSSLAGPSDQLHQAYLPRELTAREAGLKPSSALSPCSVDSSLSAFGACEGAFAEGLAIPIGETKIIKGVATGAFVIVGTAQFVGTAVAAMAVGKTISIFSSILFTVNLGLDPPSSIINVLSGFEELSGGSPEKIKNLDSAGRALDIVNTVTTGFGWVAAPSDPVPAFMFVSKAAEVYISFQ